MYGNFSKLKQDFYIKEKELIRQEEKVESVARLKRKTMKPDEANGQKAAAGWTAVTPLPKCPQCGAKKIGRVKSCEQCGFRIDK